MAHVLIIAETFLGLCTTQAVSTSVVYFMVTEPIKHFKMMYVCLST